MRKNQKYRVYCAGPLFNQKEKEEMTEIATSFEKAGFETFLPQRDGLEHCICVEELIKMGVPNDDASAVISRAIFALDIYQVLERCDAIVVNLNGRVPDEGAISEAAMAWCAGKTIVGYKADQRSVFLGEDNPLVTGLFNFEICNTIDKATERIKAAFSSSNNIEGKYNNRHIQKNIELGELLWNALNSADKYEQTTNVIHDAFINNKPLDTETVPQAMATS